MYITSAATTLHIVSVKGRKLNCYAVRIYGKVKLYFVGNINKFEIRKKFGYSPFRGNAP